MAFLPTAVKSADATDPTTDLTPEQRAWVADAVAAFVLTDDEVQQLAGDIASARIASYQAAYEDAASVVSADLGENGSAPSDEAQQEQRDLAALAAASIRDTYRRDIERTAAVVAYALGDGITGAGVAQGVSQILQQRTTWKPGQIGNAETADGADAGTFDLIDELMSGTLMGVDGNPIDISGYVLAVLPESAAEPFCADYAGETFPLDEYDELDSIFPAHPNCDHAVYLVEAGSV